MRRAFLAALFVLIAARAALGAVGDTTWTRPTHAANFPLDGLPSPSAAIDPHTAAITLGFVTPGACGVELFAGNCAANSCHPMNDAKTHVMASSFLAAVPPS